MWRAALAYGALIALVSLAMQWLDWRHVTWFMATEVYVLAVAVIFVAFGIWLGVRLTPRRAPADFQRNDRALASLGISPRELEVLDLLATGKPNKVIARDLGVSPNTVKTHMARLFAKLEASSRTEAIAKARALRLLP